MTRGAVIKALIGFVSLVVGAAILLALEKIQTDPFAFTSHTPVASEPTPAKPAAVEREHVITLADVTIVGHLSRRVVHKARAHKRAPVVATAAAATIKVVPTPCVDGQYRKLEAHRGVRLTCPH